jgi:aspartyl-tRNA(Asn)/glutamyl-tRNA(Gln) amidotransferase subunit A
MAATDPALMGLCEAADAIAAKDVSAVELTEACLARIDAWQPATNAFIDLRTDDALDQARAVDVALAKGAAPGPLAGVAVAHKDMYYRQGRISTCGAAIRRDFVADCTATVLDRLDAAGAVDLGTLHMTEFAASPTGLNDHFGPCRNPWNTDFITGGSSSGSAAATAARLVHGSLGSDTGASVRLPAAICGVVGLKGTFGRISAYGAMPRAFSLDTIGPLARNARDCARLTSVLAGHDPKDPMTSTEPVPDYEATIGDGIKGLRIAVPLNHYYDEADAGVQSVLEASVRALADAGATIVEVTIPDMEPVFRLADTVNKCEAAAIHQDWMRDRPAEYSERIFSRIEAGLHIPASRYIEALRLGGPMLADFSAAVFDHADVLHAPVLPRPVPTIAASLEASGAEVPAVITALTYYTRPINYLGLPSLAVPSGFDANGLPVSFQAIGKPFAEATLFRLAHAYEQVTDWTERVPALPAAPGTAD